MYEARNRLAMTMAVHRTVGVAAVLNLAPPLIRIECGDIAASFCQRGGYINTSLQKNAP